MFTLPLELLIFILEYLDLTHLMRLESVSKKGQLIVRSYPWKHIVKPPTNKTFEYLITNYQFQSYCFGF